MPWISGARVLCRQNRHPLGSTVKPLTGFSSTVEKSSASSWTSRTGVLDRQNSHFIEEYNPLGSDLKPVVYIDPALEKPNASSVHNSKSWAKRRTGVLRRQNTRSVENYHPIGPTNCEASGTSDSTFSLVPGLPNHFHLAIPIG